jgi:DNA-binding transcriptional MerR regulator
MILAKEVRERLQVSYIQIHRYREAGLFPWEPIAVSHQGLWSNRVYPQEAFLQLQVLEALRRRGFSIKTMRILFATIEQTEGTKDYVRFDDRARMFIEPERLEEVQKLIKLIVDSPHAGCEILPEGE